MCTNNCVLIFILDFFIDAAHTTQRFTSYDDCYIMNVWAYTMLIPCESLDKLPKVTI